MKISTKIAKLATIFLLTASFLTLGAANIEDIGDQVTFTNCGSTGTHGPSLSDCSYDHIDNVVDYGTQVWTVPETGVYRVHARGAEGGSSSGGDGAVIESRIVLEAGDEIHVVVGQRGGNTGETYDTSAGGGGTYVSFAEDIPIIVAGGGGGSEQGYGSQYPGRTGTCGGDGQSSEEDTSSGGCDGEGGATNTASTRGYGGAGYLTDGENGYNDGGEAYVDGSRGGSYDADGGFGGGGSGYSTCFAAAGAGGGYSGGAGSSDNCNDARSFSAGGGGSFIHENSIDAGTSDGGWDTTGTEPHPVYDNSITNLGFRNSGHGRAEIELVGPTGEIEVVDSSENPVENKVVDFYGDGELFGSLSTNDDGTVPLPFLINDYSIQSIKLDDEWALKNIPNDPEVDTPEITLNRDFVSEDNWINSTLVNATNDNIDHNFMEFKQAGTGVTACKLSGIEYSPLKSNIHCGLDQDYVYDLVIDTPFHQSEIEYYNVRSPDNLTAGLNQNWIPESTREDSIRFSAGHVLPSQTFVTRPFGDFDVVNVSIEKQLRDDFRLVSDVMVRKFNVQFDEGWQDWSNRRTVDIKDIYDEEWNDGTSGNDNAWGTIEFNPEGNQNSDCSDIRLTDTDNNVQDYDITQCQDEHVIMDFNVPLEAAEEKDFYIYYGNSGATDQQTNVQRPGRSLQTDFDTGFTGFTEVFNIDSQTGDSRLFTVTVPQNTDFTQTELTLSGERIQYVENFLPVDLTEGHEDFSGVELEPQREYMLEEVTLELADTTTDTELVIRDQSTGDTIYTRDIPNDGAGEYTLDFTDTSKERTGDNLVYEPGTRYFFMIRNGQAVRHSDSNTDRPMYSLEDTTVHRQLFSCETDGSGCTEGDFPTLVSGLETVDPDYPTDVTVQFGGETIWTGPEQLRDEKTVDLSGSLSSEAWREGDPIDSPLDHDFTVTSDTNGNITASVDVDVLFEHPVLEVTEDKSACTVNPQTRNYFYIDRTDCEYLDRLNVSEGQWLRSDYRFRTPGPHDFDQVGDVNEYNVTDTLVRFDILTETEEFEG